MSIIDWCRGSESKLETSGIECCRQVGAQPGPGPEGTIGPAGSHRDEEVAIQDLNLALAVPTS